MQCDGGSPYCLGGVKSVYCANNGPIRSDVKLQAIQSQSVNLLDQKAQFKKFRKKRRVMCVACRVSTLLHEPSSTAPSTLIIFCFSCGYCSVWRMVVVAVAVATWLVVAVDTDTIGTVVADIVDT